MRRETRAASEPPAQKPRDFKSGFVKGAGEQFRECLESLDPKNIIEGLKSMVDDPWGAFCSVLSSFAHIDQIKGAWDAFQSGDEYVFGEAIGKLAISVGADLLGKIVGGGAAGLVISLKSGAKAASNAADAAGDASRASRGLDACPAGAMSFSGDTRVLMADGTRKRIDQIREGDQVAAADPETGESGSRTVEATWPHRDDLITLRTSVGQIHTTEDHPYWNETDQEWEQIQQFNKGDQLLTPDGSRVTVLALDWSTRANAPAYNLTVNELHTYNVLTTSDTPVLVHNCAKHVSENDAGAYENLTPGVTGDGLEAHHMPQAGAGFTTRARGGAIVIKATDHRLTRTYGRRADPNEDFRTALARDIQDLRRIGEAVHGDPSYFNQGIKGLVTYYRTEGLL